MTLSTGMRGARRCNSTGRRSVRALLPALLLAGLVPAVLAGEPVPVTVCFDCHGPLGQSTESDVPIIAGQPVFFFVDNFLAFREGERPCRETRFRHGDTDRPPVSMCEIAEGFSEEEIQLLAEYFRNQEFRGQPQETDPALVKRGAELYTRHCEKCHTEGGSQVEDDAGILAGQWMPYLRRSLEDYREGRRIALEVAMQEKLDRLSESDVEALVHYFGSQGG